MAHKLLFAFDLKAKPITSYTAIRDRISNRFGIFSYREILNTTYIIKANLTPHQFSTLVNATGLLKTDDRYFCSDVSVNTNGWLQQDFWNFING